MFSQSYDHPEISEHADAFELPVTKPTGEDLDDEMTSSVGMKNIPSGND